MSALSGSYNDGAGEPVGAEASGAALLAQSAEDAGLDGLHTTHGDCWGPTESDCVFADELHAECRDIVRGVLAGLAKHGYRVMRDLNINPDPTACTYCGTALEHEGCPSCNAADAQGAS